MRTIPRFAYSVPKIGKGSFFPLRSVPRLIFGRAAPPSITTGVRPSLCGRLMYIRTTTLDSVHKKHKTRRYEHPSSGALGPTGVGLRAIHPSVWKNLYENVKPQSEFRRWFRHAASPTQH